MGKEKVQPQNKLRNHEAVGYAWPHVVSGWLGHLHPILEYLGSATSYTLQL